MEVWICSEAAMVAVGTIKLGCLFCQGPLLMLCHDTPDYYIEHISSLLFDS